MTSRAEQGLRLGLWILLIGGWVIAVWLMWDALTTMPAADRLESSRLVAIPTPRTFFAAAAFSGLELAVILTVLWPWRAEFYATRLLTGALALVTWFIITTPLQLTRMDWVHRGWIAAMALTLALTLVLLLAYRGGRRLLAREH